MKLNKNIRHLSLCVAGAAILAGVLETSAEAQGVTREVFRLVSSSNGDHMNSQDRYEGSQWGYYAEGSVFYYVGNYWSGTGTPAAARPIYRCRVNWDHMTSTDPNCEGWPNEGVLGYLLVSPLAGHQALYRCRTWGGEHFTSVASNCEGHVTEYLLGYVKPGYSYQRAQLATVAGDDECLGRRGAGCGWMPWESSTSACLEHDICVGQHGHAACLPGLAVAAVSYVLDGAVQLLKSVVSVFESILDWF